VSAYKRILVAVDGSPTSNKGLREALRLAQREGARLFVLNVVNDYPALAVAAEAPVMIDLLPMLREGGKRILARAQAAALKAKVKPVLLTREIVGGPAADAIVREARKQRADLIVLGTHGRRGVRRLVLGSDAEQVVRTSRVPVLLVRA
jgi:nucleotide-binding universal stress UspA family protein